MAKDTTRPPVMQSDAESLEVILSERAQQLFLLSDQERKGFIIKRDMQHMRCEVPLTPEQLEFVFETLDVHNNGYITIEQFLSGFGKFLNSNGHGLEDLELLKNGTEEQENRYFPLLQQLSSINTLHNLDMLKQMCHLVETEGSLQVQDCMESFLHQLIQELSRHEGEVKSLEETLRARDAAHNKEMEKLYDDITYQLNEEKIKLAKQEERKQCQGRNNLQHKLIQSEEYVQQLLHQHHQMQVRLQENKTKVTSIKQQNTDLLETKEELERKAEQWEVYHLQQKFELDRKAAGERWERKKCFLTGFTLAKGIMLEQEGLRQQLNILKSLSATLKGVDIVGDFQNL